jgi:hypothetical protein
MKFDLTEEVAWVRAAGGDEFAAVDGDVVRLKVYDDEYTISAGDFKRVCATAMGELLEELLSQSDEIASERG